MITVRPLAPGDSFVELTDLLHAAYAPLAAQGMRYLASHQDAATTEKRAKSGICFVAEGENQTLVGTITLYGPHADSPCEIYREPDVWHFAQFAVLPAYQSHGVGGRLLETVETTAKNAGAARLACDTSEHARDLIAFYARKGYEPAGRVVWHNVTNYESVVLVKSLLNTQETNSSRTA